MTSIFRYSKNYGSLTHETRIKDAVNMEDLICLLATVRTLNGLVSRALQDGHISNEEFQIILQEMESYRDHKSQIRNKITADIRELTVDKENEIREESFKKGILKGQEMALVNPQNIMKNISPP